MQETARLEQKEKLTITQQKRTFSNLNDSARSPYDVINEASRGDVPVQKKKRSDKLNEWWAIAIWTNIATSIYNQALTLLLVSDPLTNFVSRINWGNTRVRQ